MIDSQIAVQQAIYDHLNDDATLMALIQGVYDMVPDDAVFPFITIGNMTSIDGSTKGIDGQEITLVIHAWSQGESRLEIKQIMAAVINSLHNTALVPSGSPQVHNIVNTRYEYTDLFKDPDGRTHHGVIRFRIVTDETA